MNAGILILSLMNPVLAQDSNNLKRDMKALELYLQDQDDHKRYCPKLQWNQPSIEVYKQRLSSQLPKKCKK